MTYEEIVEKGKEFADKDIAKMYTVIALFAEWQKETGGTAEDFLNYLCSVGEKKHNSRRA